ncbi:hypothetical protein HUG17_2774 [Dermatophagoides farinae]|uniref:Uncharacterized protein n=1 Tax=Dermatophagoides farinae TaxID=6954 RepID=A0A9D4NTI5_DERFA|nr:hypothetical protein HUG17_2774 [Dermatophagoides farinae]
MSEGGVVVCADSRELPVVNTYPLKNVVLRLYVLNAVLSKRMSIIRITVTMNVFRLLCIENIINICIVKEWAFLVGCSDLWRWDKVRGPHPLVLDTDGNRQPANYLQYHHHFGQAAGSVGAGAEAGAFDVTWFYIFGRQHVPISVRNVTNGGAWFEIPGSMLQMVRRTWRPMVNVIADFRSQRDKQPSQEPGSCSWLILQMGCDRTRQRIADFRSQRDKTALLSELVHVPGS